jgi:Flagellar hook-length control protein FliK
MPFVNASLLLNQPSQSKDLGVELGFSAEKTRKSQQASPETASFENALKQVQSSNGKNAKRSAKNVSGKQPPLVSEKKSGTKALPEASPEEPAKNKEDFASAEALSSSRIQDNPKPPPPPPSDEQHLNTPQSLSSETKPDAFESLTNATASLPVALDSASPMEPSLTLPEENTPVFQRIVPQAAFSGMERLTLGFPADVPEAPMVSEATQELSSPSRLNSQNLPTNEASMAWFEEALKQTEAKPPAEERPSPTKADLLEKGNLSTAFFSLNAPSSSLNRKEPLSSESKAWTSLPETLVSLSETPVTDSFQQETLSQEDREGESSGAQEQGLPEGASARESTPTPFSSEALSFQTSFINGEVAFSKTTQTLSPMEALKAPIEATLQSAKAGDSHTIRMKLQPEALGEVQVQIRLDAQKSVAMVFQVQTPEAYQALSEQLQGLQSDLEKQNLSLGSLQVTLASAIPESSVIQAMEASQSFSEAFQQPSQQESFLASSETENALSGSGTDSGFLSDSASDSFQEAQTLRDLFEQEARLNRSVGSSSSLDTASPLEGGRLPTAYQQPQLYPEQRLTRFSRINLRA